MSQNINEKIPSPFSLILKHCQFQQNLMKFLQYPGLHYGFAYFGMKIGYCGVISILSFIFEFGLFNQSKITIRFLRQSTFVFCKNIVKMKKHIDINDNSLIETTIEDGEQLKNLCMMSVGILSFLNLKLLENKKKNIRNISNEYNKMLQYMNKFIIGYIEPFIKQLIPGTKNIWIESSLYAGHLILLLACAIRNNSDQFVKQYECVKHKFTMSQWRSFGHIGLSILNKHSKHYKRRTMQKQILQQINEFIVSLKLKILTNFNISTISVIKNAHANQIELWLQYVVLDQKHALRIKWKNVMHMKQCTFCGDTSVLLKKCFKGKVAHFCNRKCQKKYWNKFNGLLQ